MLRWERGGSRLDWQAQSPAIPGFGNDFKKALLQPGPWYIWMGGWAPLGYEVRDRKLIVNEADAKLVRSIFQRFLKMGSATTLARQLIAENTRNKYGKLIDKGRTWVKISGAYLDTKNNILHEPDGTTIDANTGLDISTRPTSTSSSSSSSTSDDSDPVDTTA